MKEQQNNTSKVDKLTQRIDEMLISRGLKPTEHVHQEGSSITILHKPQKSSESKRMK